MNDYDASHTLQSYQHKTQLIRSLINFGLADLSNPEGSLGEEHHTNLYKTILDILDQQNEDLNKLLIK